MRIIHGFAIGFAHCVAIANSPNNHSMNCGAVTFNIENLDLNRLEPKHLKEKCRQFWMGSESAKISVSLAFSDTPEAESEMLSFGREETNAPGPAPEFVGVNRRKRKYQFNFDIFSEAVNGWPIYAGRMEEMMRDESGIKTSQAFRCGNSPEGNYVISEMRYRGKKNGRRWIEGYFMFYRSGIVSVNYWSPLLSADSPVDMSRYQRMVSVFKSMKYTGHTMQHGKTIKYGGCE